jgi:hypothetical protein
MAFPVIPALLGAGALLFVMTGKSSAATSPSAPYKVAPPDGSSPAKIEPKPAPKNWKEMSESLQAQVASALGQLGVSPATGELTGAPVTADAIKLATQTAALCESQGFYDVAKDLRRWAEQAAKAVPTPPAAAPMKEQAPPGLNPAQVEALVRTLTLDRDPKVIQGVIDTLKKLPQSPQRDYFIGMAQALMLQLQAAQSTTQTMQQIDEVIKSPTVAEVVTAVKPLPPVIVPVATTSTSPGWPQPKPSTSTAPPIVKLPPTVFDKPLLSLAAFPDPTPKARLMSRALKSKGEDVKSWQRIMKRFGYDIGTFGPAKDGVDGDFGATMDKVTRAFQTWGFTRTRDPQIKIDGVVGPVTRRLVLLKTADMKAAAA